MHNTKLENEEKYTPQFDNFKMHVVFVHESQNVVCWRDF